MDDLLSKSMQTGCWLLLQNAHFNKQYIEELNILVNDIQNEKFTVSDNFRLFITTQIYPEFPIQLVLNSNKIMVEEPLGIKNKLKYLSK